MRLGLSWLLLHLVFIYLALWTQLPELYAGRHIYQGMIGLILAIGATFEMVLGNFSLPQRVQRRREGNQRFLQPQQAVIVLALLLVTAVSWHHLQKIQASQQLWLNNVAEEAEAREQLSAKIPSITPDDHFFAVRFPIAPTFTRTVIQLWYDTPLESPGGDLAQLRRAGRADPSFVVLDYRDGVVYNLMPSLQQYEETIFLWADEGELVWLDENGNETAVTDQNRRNLAVYRATNGSQLALNLHAENGRWLAHKVDLTLPVNSELQTAVLPTFGLQYRLRLVTNSGEARILYESGETVGTVWQPVAIPLGLFADTAVTLYFEVRGENLTDDSAAYWANPRLVRGELDR